MPTFKKIISVLILSAILILPSFASAAIVNCGGTNQDGTAQKACTYCDLLDMGQNILDFIVKYVLFTGGVIFIMWGGFDMIMSGGDSKKYLAGVTRIKATLIGILIAFAAWFIVNAVLNILAVDETGQPMNIVWDKIDCEQISPTNTSGGGGKTLKVE
jgi:hypothetical protein